MKKIHGKQSYVKIAERGCLVEKMNEYSGLNAIEVSFVMAVSSIISYYLIRGFGPKIGAIYILAKEIIHLIF